MRLMFINNKLSRDIMSNKPIQELQIALDTIIKNATSCHKSIHTTQILESALAAQRNLSAIKVEMQKTNDEVKLLSSEKDMIKIQEKIHQKVHQNANFIDLMLIRLTNIESIMEGNNLI